MNGIHTVNCNIASSDFITSIRGNVISKSNLDAYLLFEHFNHQVNFEITAITIKVLKHAFDLLLLASLCTAF